VALAPPIPSRDVLLTQLSTAARIAATGEVFNFEGNNVRVL
jgi:hypothetical protein